jgi:hypothetical protein
MADIIPLESPAAGEGVAQIAERREAAARAAATPLPGPLADAFAIAPEIPVGNYKVRAFLECDFEFLKALEHPLYEILIDLWTGTKDSKNDYFPRGQLGWDICFMFTHSADEVETLLKQGKSAFEDAAKTEFSRLPGAAIVKIHSAAKDQCLIAFSTLVQHGVSSSDDEGSKKNAAA